MVQNTTKRKTEIMTGLMSACITDLSDNGYRNVTVDNIFTDKLYSFHFEHALVQSRLRALSSDVVDVCNFLLEKIKLNK